MTSDLASRVGRHGVTALAVALAVGALVEDLARPTVDLDAGTFDRGPEAVIVTVLAGVAVVLALRGRLGVVAPLAALALFALASFPAPAWVLDSTFVYLLVMLSCGLAGYLTQSRRELMPGCWWSASLVPLPCRSTPTATSGAPCRSQSSRRSAG